jgi:hypothetical protein
MNTCTQCQHSFQVRDEDREFYKKFDVPDPKMCPDCRLQRRLVFRNERMLYNRTSTLSGQKIISIYHDQCRYPVYSPEEWWSDQWDGLSYGRDFDFSRPFFEQFQELMLKVPRIALFNVNPTNSDYCQQAYDNKDCYLCMVVTTCEDSLYLSHTNKAKDSVDCTYVQNMELSYECLDSDNLYGCTESQSCQNSSGLMFCYDCIGCQDCFASHGLRNKKYYINNKRYSKEEYEEKIKSLELNKASNYLKYKKYFQEAAKSRIARESRNLNVFDTVGNYLINAQNAYQCYDCFQIQDCAYCTWIFESNNCYDVYGLGGSAWVLNCLGNENVNNVAFNTFVSDGGDIFYSDLCFYSMNLFGCVGLRNKKHCILNKQYSVEDYEVMKAKIVEHMKKTGEWGEFFPASLSPFAYNETAAPNYFPLTKEQALAQGFAWKDVSKKDYEQTHYQIPDDINAVQNDLLEATLNCGLCGKRYQIQEQELRFHKQRSLPIPKKCPDCRYKNRLALRNPRTLYDRACAKCQAAIQTTYAPNRPEIVQCEKCYREAVD